MTSGSDAHEASRAVGHGRDHGAGRDHGGHGHPGHNHGAGATRSRLAVAFWLTTTVLVVELVGAVITGSLALAVDAIHMLTDVLGLGLALLASHLSMRPATARYTWGYERAETLSATAQAAILLGAGLFAVIEGVRRIASPAEVPGLGLMVFGVVGLVANVISLAVLAGGHKENKENLNFKAALLEVINDAFGSVAVLVAGALTLWLGWGWADTVAGLLVAALILPRAVVILRRSVRILMEAAPRGVEAEELRGHLEQIPSVQKVHDLHISRLSSATAVLTAHVVVDASAFADGSSVEVLRRLQECAAGHFPVRFEHATFQLEPPSTLTRERPLHGGMSPE
ncbi:cation diffusion facilitator family transporter [Galactobacter sp.]|uniref:cation diffusion facilitator family transporter n=1 Tax=Galactobacter sp. TaxID=2676125 RepID=UPI0025B8961E|nr:cation diffusion facilitator family transporter [Galactobacter sp.]